MSGKLDQDLLNAVVRGDFLDRLAVTDRVHGDSGLELRALRVALAHG